MLGLQVEALGAGGTAHAPGWNAAQRAALQAAIEAREPFLDFVCSRVGADGKEQVFQVSGEPMFGPACRFLGYRGIGLDVTGRKTR